MLRYVGCSRVDGLVPGGWGWVGKVLLFAAVCMVGVAAARGEGEHRMSAQEIVHRVAESAQKQVAAKEEHVRKCTCSNHTCANEKSVWPECTQSLGTDGSCDGGCSGMKVNFEHSGVRTPPGADPESLGANVAESICLHQDMDNVFQELAEAGAVNTWTYFGSAAGVMRTWPSKARERALTSGSYDPKLGNCRTYEPRLRPWYIAAVTSAGPKDLIILLDTSGSMSSLSGSRARISIAHDVISNLLAYTSRSDHVAIIPFGSEPKPLISDELIIASTPNKKALFDAVIATSVADSGKPNLDAAFQKAFEILSFSMNGYKTSACQRMIFLLSDGHFCEDQEAGVCEEISLNYPDIAATIENEQKKLVDQNVAKASIFTSSIGRNSRNGLMRQISCENDGTWVDVTDLDDPLVKLTSYVSVLTSKRADDDLVWSGFYIDDSGLGEMTTAALPVFSFNNTGLVKGELVGVVGHDIPLSQLQDRGVSYQGVLGTVTRRISSCNVRSLGTCPMQVLRGSMGQCPGILSQAHCYKESTTNHIYFSAQEALTQEQAVESCKILGGYLADLTLDEEIGLAGGIAAASGSWIGLHLEGGAHWVWKRNASKLTNGPSLWAPGFQDSRNECASVDRRGARQNVVRNDCFLKLPYICEFDSISDASIVCKSKNVEDFEQAYLKTIPTVKQCFEKSGQPEGVMKGAAFGNPLTIGSKALCPLSNHKSTEELVCCKGCCKSGQKTCEESNALGLMPFLMLVRGLLCICLLITVN